MSASFKLLKSIVLAAGLSGLTAGAHAAGGLTGVALAPGENCAIQYYQHNMNGPLLVKAAAGQSGSYRLTLSRYNSANEIILQTSGNFRSIDWRDTVLTRASLMSTDFRRGRVGGVDEYLIEARLEVYDDRGRLTCTANQVQIRPLSQIAGSTSTSRLEYVPAHETAAEPSGQRPQLLPQYRNRQPLRMNRSY